MEMTRSVRLKDGREVAIRLFTKLGFEEEGRMRDCFYGEDGRYRDIIAMGKILG